jgi:hypothetical protein
VSAASARGPTWERSQGNRVEYAWGRETSPATPSTAAFSSQLSRRSHLDCRAACKPPGRNDLPMRERLRPRPREPAHRQGSRRRGRNRGPKLSGSTSRALPTQAGKRGRFRSGPRFGGAGGGRGTPPSARRPWAHEIDRARHRPSSEFALGSAYEGRFGRTARNAHGADLSDTDGHVGAGPWIPRRLERARFRKVLSAKADKV